MKFNASQDRYNYYPRYEAIPQSPRYVKDLVTGCSRCGATTNGDMCRDCKDVARSEEAIADHRDSVLIVGRSTREHRRRFKGECPECADENHEQALAGDPSDRVTHLVRYPNCLSCIDNPL